MLKDLHSNISKDVWPEGAKLKCKTCGEIITITTEECGKFLASGWPEHHGITMIMVSDDTEE
jgi:hypothetical protein